MLNFYGSFFTLIFAVLLVGVNFFMRPEYLTMAISDLKFNTVITCCYLGTIRDGKLKFKLEIAIIKYSGLI